MPSRGMGGLGVVGRWEPRSGFHLGSGFRISKSPMGDRILDSTKPVVNSLGSLCVNQSLTLAWTLGGTLALCSQGHVFL